MKAEKYLKIINRMCNVFNECSDCPNYKVICNVEKNVEKLEVDVKKSSRNCRRMGQRKSCENKVVRVFETFSECRNGIRFGIWKIFS